MNDFQLHRLDLNLLVTFEVLMDERSVTRAADRLGRTPSAVSHALARLREQVGDPLMVKVGGRMQPSPFAEALIEEIRPVLRTISRVVQPPQPFDPATSHRVFRIAAPAIPPLISDLSTRMHAVAPLIGLEWLALTPQSYAQVVDGQVDLALGAMEIVPEGAMQRVLPPIHRYTFARRDHPALKEWNEAAWLGWPHVVVGMSDAARQTVEERAAELGVQRRIGARIPEFSGVAPLLAQTNMIANQLVVFLIDDIAQYGLRLLEPPVPLPDITMRFVWNARLANEPGARWFRDLVVRCYDDLTRRGEALLEAAEVIRPG